MLLTVSFAYLPARAAEPDVPARIPGYAVAADCPTREAWQDALRARLPEALRAQVAGRFDVQIELHGARYVGTLGGLLDTKPQRPKTPPATSVARRPPPVRMLPVSRAQDRVTDLAAEMRAIENVQTLLGWGQAQQADAALRDYRASFPHGELALEADLLNVDVALAQGDLARARALARDLLERPGAGRYRARLSSMLETNASAQGSKPGSR